MTRKTLFKTRNFERKHGVLVSISDAIQVAYATMRCATHGESFYRNASIDNHNPHTGDNTNDHWSLSGDGSTFESKIAPDK